jgi:ribulose-phosphate 3-epimerase
MKSISVSVLSSKNEAKDIEKLNYTNADFLHVDEMDGRFVKQKHKTFRMLNKMSNRIYKRLDVHLMVKKPFKLINKYASLNTEYITVPVEIEKVDKCLDLIKEYGIKCGLAISPDTDESILLPYINKIDLIIIMGVYPGKGGQEFIPDTIKRILKIKKIIVAKRAKVKISIDGGVNEKVAKKLDFVDIIVTGSYVTNSDDFDEAIEKIRRYSDKLSTKDKESKKKEKEKE